MKRFSPATFHSPLPLASGLAVILGTVVRLAITYPVHKYLPDADAVLTGLTAFKILDGDPVVFYSGVRLGAFESYVHAVSFLLLGRSRVALAVAPLAFGILTLIAFALLAHRVLPRRAATVAVFLVAIPPPAFLYWLYMPNGYSATILFSTLSLWLASLLRRPGSQPWIVFAYGVAVGLAWWNSPLSIAVTLPSIVWLAWSHPGPLRRLGFWIILTGGLSLGAAPWVLYNIKVPLASFKGEWGAAPAAGAAAMASNIRYVVTYQLPALIAEQHPVPPPDLGGRAGGLVFRALIGMIYAAGAVLAVARLLQARRQRLNDAAEASAIGLGFLIIGATAVLNIASQFGSVRGLTVRYVLPLYLGLALIMGISFGFALGFQRVAGVLALASLVAFNASGYYWPWTTERKVWRHNLAREEQLLAYLERRHIEWVFGDYWSVYPLNFTSDLRILGIPYQRVRDFYNYADRLPAREAKWLILSWEPGAIEPLVRTAGLSGTTTQLDEGLVVFEPSRLAGRPNMARDTVEKLRRVLVPPDGD